MWYKYLWVYNFTIVKDLLAYFWQQIRFTFVMRFQRQRGTTVMQFIDRCINIDGTFLRK